MSESESAAAREAVELIRLFLRGPDRSMALAWRIEGLLDAAFPDHLEVEDLVVALACYRPEGGPHLYDEAEMVAVLQRDLPVIERLAAG